MLVWGGDGRIDYGDGAAYDPRGNRWRRLRAAPLRPRFGHTAVYTGREMIVWGGGARGGFVLYSDGAAYDPRADSWRRIARAPLTARRGHTAVWTGREMIVYGGFVGEANGYESGEAAAYDPLRNRWRSLPSWLARWSHTAVWTGREMIVWGGDGPQELERGGARLNPSSGRWRPLPRSPLEGRAGHATVWTGRAMIVVGGASNRPLAREGAAYEPATDRWRELPRSPGRFLVSHTALWTGDYVLVIDRGTRPLIYRPRTRTWVTLANSLLRSRGEFVAVQAGRDTVVWGGEGAPDADYFRDGAILTGLPGR